jgi:hypothetical protein
VSGTLNASLDAPDFHAVVERILRWFPFARRRRTTPEVRFLFAELGASMPYRAASKVLGTCGFGDMRASHMAIRRHTLAMGHELEAHRLDLAEGHTHQAPGSDKSLVVGIDDTYVKCDLSAVATKFFVAQWIAARGDLDVPYIR